MTHGEHSEKVVLAQSCNTDYGCQNNSRHEKSGNYWAVLDDACTEEDMESLLKEDTTQDNEKNFDFNIRKQVEAIVVIDRST